MDVPTGPEWAEASRLAAARRDAYRLLASLWLEPPPATEAGLAGLGAALSASFGAVDEQLASELEGGLRSPGAVRELRDDYRALIVVPSTRNLVPVESVYAGASFDGSAWRLGRLRSARWHCARRAYAEAGFEVDEAAAVEADHLCCELQFLARLCDEEAVAWAAQRCDDAMAHRRRALAFLSEHPASWIRRLRQRAADLARTAFYRLVPLLTERFLALEQRHLQEAG